MAGEILLLVLVTRRGLWRTAPFFCGYLAWSLLADGALSLALWRLSAAEYSYLYIQQLPVDYMARFMVLSELVLAVWNRSQTRRSQRMEFLLVGMLLVGMLLLWPITLKFTADNLSRHAALFTRMQAEFSLMFVACWLVLEGLRRKLSWDRRDPEVQIVRGFGAYATVNLYVVLARQDPGLNREDNYWLNAHLEMFGYLFLVSYWVFCFWGSRTRLDAEG